MRRIFSTVFGPHDPALTVGSLAINATGRPSIVPTPVTTPSAPRPSSCQLASSASSEKLRSSSSSAMRSRTPSLPCPLAFSRWRSGPPAERARGGPAQVAHGRGSPRYRWRPRPRVSWRSWRACSRAWTTSRSDAGPNRRPGVAHDGQQRDADHPARPEAAAAPAGQPDAHAQRRHAQRPAGLLEQTPAQLRLALAQRQLHRGRADGQVGTHASRSARVDARVGHADALLELLRGEPARAARARAAPRSTARGRRPPHAGSTDRSCRGVYVVRARALEPRRGAVEDQIRAFSAGDSPEYS